MSSIRSLSFALALGVAGFPGVQMAAAASLEETLVQFADTPAEHQALADYYKGQAAEARAEAEAHRKMGKTYSGLKNAEMQAMAAHCDKIATQQDDLAKQYDQLAAGHLAQAK